MTTDNNNEQPSMLSVFPAEELKRMMLHLDVNNGISRRSWARNEGAMFAIKRAMDICPELKVTMPNLVDDEVLEGLF